MEIIIAFDGKSLPVGFQLEFNEPRCVRENRTDCDKSKIKYGTGFVFQRMANGMKSFSSHSNHHINATWKCNNVDIENNFKNIYAKITGIGVDRCYMASNAESSNLDIHVSNPFSPRFGPLASI